MLMIKANISAREGKRRLNREAHGSTTVVLMRFTWDTAALGPAQPEALTLGTLMEEWTSLFESGL